MWETIRGYLTFTRKERYGVLFLLVLIIILFILPYFFRPAVGEPDPAAYEKMKEGIQKLESGLADSSLEKVAPSRYADRKRFGEEINSGKSGPPVRTEMFYFDPNRLNARDWRRLGLSEHLTQTILHYIEKGGHFRRAEDLKKLYGLHDADYDRLFPYVRMTQATENFRTRSGYYAKTSYNLPALKKADSIFRAGPVRTNPEYAIAHYGKKFEVTDINLSDSEIWSGLPGIGAKLASRIVRFREKLGGFYQVEQVGETFALPDSVFQKIKPYLRLINVDVHQMDLNSATQEVLQSHPYIRWQLAKRIIDYREQHGGFKAVDELLQLAQMDPVRFEKLKPYLLVKF
jgi:competence protein ComEA